MRMTIRKVILCLSVITIFLGGILCVTGLFLGADVSRAGIRIEIDFNHGSHYERDEINEFMNEFGIENFMEGNSDEKVI